MMFSQVLKNLLYLLIIFSISLQNEIANGGPISVSTKISTAAHDNTQGSLWIRLRNQFTINYSENGTRVQQHIHKFTRGNWLNDQLRVKAAPYLYLVLEEVEKKGMPTELALLPLVESDYQPNAIQARTGAAGLWQIMSETGAWFGLKQDPGFDGRQDIHASTQAALSHLSYLHKTFKGDWLLALAAYNCGEGRVKRAMQQNKASGLPTDYWSLPLPQETRNYVPKLLALVSIIKQPTKYGFTLPHVADQPYLARVKVEPGLDLRLAAKMADISLSELSRHNAGLQKPVIPSRGPFYLLVPVTKAARFQQKLATSDDKKTQQPFRYSVQKGDSLSQIANNYQTTIAEIQKANQLNSIVVHPGQTLSIPGRYQPVPVNEKAKEAIIHIVQRGDSLWTISQLYQIPVSAIIKRNNLGASTTLQLGRRIIIEDT